jgi:hypothetical protein
VEFAPLLGLIEYFEPHVGGRAAEVDPEEALAALPARRRQRSRKPSPARADRDRRRRGQGHHLLAGQGVEVELGVEALTDHHGLAARFEVEIQHAAPLLGRIAAASAVPAFGRVRRSGRHRSLGYS